MQFKADLVFAALALTGVATAQSAAAASSSATISIPATPTNAYSPIDRQFPGIAFEFGAFNISFGEAGHPNHFAINLIDSIFNLTGARPFVRVGGTSGDQDAHYTPTEPGGGHDYAPSFFTAFQNAPHAEFIFQVPFRPNDTNNTVAFFEAGFKNIGADRLYAVEIGNEENSFVKNNQGQVDYAAYVSEYLRYENAIVATGLLQNDTIFQGLDSASAEGEFDFTPAQVFPHGLNTNGRIKTVAMHYYQTKVGNDLQSELMNHTAITSRMAPYDDSIKYMRKNYPKVPFLIDEIGNSLLDSKPEPFFQESLGAALWAVDFLLYCMVLGVGRTSMQVDRADGFTPFVDGGAGAEVRAPYYAQPFAASFIGSSAADTAVAIVSNVTTYPAYAAYDGGRLARLALVNFELWNPSTASAAAPRPTHTFALGVPSAVATARVERLQSPEGAYANASSITLGGTQWTYESLGRPVHGVRNDSFTVEAEHGVLRVPVPASEAVIVYV